MGNDLGQLKFELVNFPDLLEDYQESRDRIYSGLYRLRPPKPKDLAATTPSNRRTSPVEMAVLGLCSEKMSSLEHIIHSVERLLEFPADRAELVRVWGGRYLPSDILVDHYRQVKESLDPHGGHILCQSSTS